MLRVSPPKCCLSTLLHSVSVPAFSLNYLTQLFSPSAGSRRPPRPVTENLTDQIEKSTNVMDTALGR
ncbi:hypothetical protein E2C01_050325 [Portunus trituberculatus]|uniref:Uncharacterized protein n=1 Tax=Portunus trituberculatus TaxID=210409 RepID=A0A5B7GGG2_PORTR|nr:hypothetical protein [Portunus trituberculatus]